ncbi:MAG: hypothetical protein ACRDRT_12420 [Pseudonocardiaceae bacterium]
MSDTPIYDQLCGIYGSPWAPPGNGPSDLDTVELAIPVRPGTAREGRAGPGRSDASGQRWFEESPLSEPQFPRPGERPHSR